jgi:regulator of protease activity HflC (stomatin/prohibitin superfamily)
VNSADWMALFGGAATSLVGLSLVGIAGKAVTIEVEDEHVALVTSFGKLVAKLDKPGLRVMPTKWLPWVKVHHVPMARDYRIIHELHLNDARGTTLSVDLWMEQRVVDAERFLFATEDAEQATQNVVVHAAMSLLGGRDFQQILDDQSDLGRQLQREVSAETERWGISIEQVFVRNITLLPEVSQQVFGTVAARLERARAVLVERGRLDAAQLEADTAKKVATLVATAKGQYPLAVGRALERLRRSPKVFEAYNELYELSQLRGARTVAFRGFDGKDLRALDAAMLPDPAANAPAKS